MKGFCILLPLLMLTLGCTDLSGVPSGIIPPKKMKLIIWDIIQAERYADGYLAKDSARLDVKKETFRLYDDIFQIHHTNKEEFIKSYKYYLNHPNLTSAMFDSLSTLANTSREQLY